MTDRPPDTLIGAVRLFRTAGTPEAWIYFRALVDLLSEEEPKPRRGRPLGSGKKAVGSPEDGEKP